MLNILEADDLQALGHNSADYLHLLIEAKKLAFADLDAWLADPERARCRSSGSSPRNTPASSASASTASAATDVESGVDQRVDFSTRDGDTVYLTVVDKERNVVSFINVCSGSSAPASSSPATGFMLQNRGALFSLDPTHPNRLEPRKRPYPHDHSGDGLPATASPGCRFGVMGGDMQPQGHVQVLLNMLEFGMNVQDAGDAPRFRHHPAKASRSSRASIRR